MSQARAAGAALFVLLALYLSFPDKVFVFDGIMFSGVIERAVDEWRRELFNKRHLLFNPLMMGLRDLLSLAGVGVGGYALIQRVNAFAGAAGVFVFFSLLKTLSPRTPRAAAAAAALLSVTAAYWSRATEGQVYMLMTLGGLATALAAARLVQAPSPGRAAALAAAFSIALLLHAANVALAPLALLAAALAGRADRRVWLAAPAAAVVVAAAYGAAFGGGALLHPFSFLGEATEQSSLAGLLASSGALARVGSVVSGLGTAFLGERPPAAALQLAGGLLLLLGAFAAREALRKSRDQALLALAWAGGVVALEAVWLGGQFFWASPAAALLALVVLAWGRETSAAFAAALVLGGWTLFATILPQSKLENNVGYARSVFVRDHTPASSWVVVSGFGFPNQKVYLPYFARRSREVLEYYLSREPKGPALEKFRAFVAANIEKGIPMYLLPDLVEDPVSLEALRRNFGVTPEDVRAAFGPGDLLEAARQDAGFRIFLFAPEPRRERLFAVLGYSVLTESEPARLQETARLLKELGARMTPQARREAARVMHSTDYGARLLMEGFSAFMSPESRAAADRRLARFAEYRKTADFHLRLGNIMRYLGLADETRAAWRKAYELSGDKSLLPQINALK